VRALVLVIAMTSVAAADPMWIGTFVPTAKAGCTTGCEAAKTVAHPGYVRVLTPPDGKPAAEGRVMVVQPLTYAYGTGIVDKGVITLISFPYDENRDTDNSVLVVPSGSKAIVVPIGKADIAAIKDTLLAKAEELANVRKSVASLEVAGVDTDGDGKPDLAVTYGCNVWADGSCQSRGQFFLARRGQRWVVIE
jgi:hypothetical protein